MSSRTMRVHVALCCMAVACCSPEGNIRGAANLRFLDVEYFNRSDVDKLVAWQMNHTLQNSSRLRHLHADLEPIFRTLAKMPSGGLSHQGARYALFRFFLHERSWLVKGLEPEGRTQSFHVPKNCKSNKHHNNNHSNHHHHHHKHNNNNKPSAVKP